MQLKSGFAAALLAFAAPSYGEDMQSIISQSQKMMDQKDYYGAKSALEAAVKDSPASAEAHHLLGISYLSIARGMKGSPLGGLYFSRAYDTLRMADNMFDRSHMAPDQRLPLLQDLTEAAFNSHDFYRGMRQVVLYLNAGGDGKDISTILSEMSLSKDECRLMQGYAEKVLDDQRVLQIVSGPCR
jgi:hypothetical protein